MTNMRVQQAFQFVLDPEPRQARMLASHAGGARYAFNWGLATFAESLDARQAEKAAGVEKPTTKLPGHFDLCKLWNVYKDDPASEVPWVGNNFSGTYQAALRDAHAAWKNFLDSKTGRRAGRMGRPRFKSRHRSTPAFQLHGTGLRVEDHRHIRLPKIGVVRSHEKTKKLRRLLNRPPVPCDTCSGSGQAKTLVKQPRDYDGPEVYELQPCKTCYDSKTKASTGLLPHTRIVRGSITRTPSGRWRISLTVETHREVRTDADGNPKPTKRQLRGGTVGIDWGVRELATLSNGEVITNPRHLNAALDKLRRAQQDLSRKKKDSQGRERARRRVAKLHGRIAALREDYLEKATSQLVHSYAHIAVESWDVQKTMAKEDPGIPKRVRRDRNRVMADTGIGMTRWMIEHKAPWYGAKVTVTGANEPTGRTCSACEQVRTKPVQPADELFKCPSCGHVVDRRVNTARMLARLAHSSDAPGSGESKNARGAGVRLGAPRRTQHPASKREARTGPSGPGKTSTPDP